jgi:uncharacterized membrane protein YoaK (UPF0700 family)
MFIAQAHSFTQQARLAITLAWVAGYTNILAVLTCGHVVSHASGTASDLGRFAVDGAWSALGFAAFLLVSFLLGAIASGFTTELGRRRGWESVYVLPMILQALLLTGFAAGVNLHDPEVLETGASLYVMTGLASGAMGLQNATITRISAGVVRTTHVTGVLTDLGTELVSFVWFLAEARRNGGGAILREVRRHAGARRLALLASILLSFAFGAGLGTMAYEQAHRLAMFPPVLFLLWIIAQDLRQPIAEIEPSEIVADLGHSLPESLAVVHLRRDTRRGGAAGGMQRMPDLMAWMDRLAPHVRVVVLDLDRVTRMDADSALELRAALRRASAEGRRLILAGLTPAQFAELSRAGGESLDPLSACTDLELAVARGLGYLSVGGEGVRNRG